MARLPLPRRGLGRWVGLAARRAIVTVAGSLVVAVGLVMLVTPGPGIAAVITGLAILATEYDWARRLYRDLRRRSREAYNDARTRIETRRDARRQRRDGQDGTSATDQAA